MDVAWQDGVGSFLDSAGTDPSSFASFASGDGGALWSSAADSRLFSGQSVLWESSADSPGNSHVAAFSSDATATDASTVPVSWIADGAAGLASGSPTLDGGLLWAGAGDTSGALMNSGGADGLGSLAALDLGTGSGTSQWQQFVSDFANQSATWLADVPHLLWTSGSGQAPLTPTVAGDSLHLAGGITTPTFPTLAPEHLMWTDPSTATGLTAGPPLVDAAPTGMFGVGAGMPTSGGLPLAGVGSHP